ncbi:hypothetical protein NLU13_0133 [Sarocladium strictum]|uniref:CENP-V/GFA domain-containing protein n=1 Tax=Sarocladium strictum TaxID=5046 RepID=A0AA39GPA5_SARSR|nr:hypothetical protein NLU13_0133 [Sarocladium strictum]
MSHSGSPGKARQSAAILTAFLESTLHMSSPGSLFDGPCNMFLETFVDARNVDFTTREGCLGEYTLSDTSSGSPEVKIFCRICGCTIWTAPASSQGQFYLVRMPFLDQGLDIKPTNELFTKNRPV